MELRTSTSDCQDVGNIPGRHHICDDLPATITNVPVAAVLVLNTPDDGRLRPK